MLICQSLSTSLCQYIHKNSVSFSPQAFHRYLKILFMAFNSPWKKCFVTKTKEEEEEEENMYKRYKEIISTLPREKGWSTEHIYQYQGYWFEPMAGLEGIMAVQQHFKAQPTDILVCSTPKAGTTWLKSLIFTIVNRNRYCNPTHPLLTFSPHDCVPLLELDFYRINPFANPDLLPSPRLFGTHIPYGSLPESVMDSGCLIVYICRNPKDLFVSMWHFMIKLRSNELPPLILEETFKQFCDGISPFGPFWDHVLEYWNASLECPNRVLFLTYENMKREPLIYIQKLAKFVGNPFSLDEEKEGVVEEIVKLCSFENMSNLEVNKTGIHREGLRNNVFFRRAKVGDWENHLTPEMIERIDRIMEQKLAGSNLTFQAHPEP